MSDNVSILPGKGKREPNAMLLAARKAGLTDVVIVGWDGNEELWMSSSLDELSQMHWLLHLGSKEVDRMLIGDDDVE